MTNPSILDRKDGTTFSEFGYVLSKMENCSCPILGPKQYAKKFKMTEKEIERHCEKGCCPICDKILSEKFRHRQGRTTLEAFA